MVTVKMKITGGINLRIALTTFRTIFAIIAIVFIVYFIVSLFAGLDKLSCISGLLLSLWVMCVSIKPIYVFIKDLCFKTGFTHILFVIVNVCFIIFAAYGALVSGAMAICASQAPAENSTAVVLGAQVKPWGPSTILRGRINAAEKYLNENPDACAVLTGGKGDDEPISEAQSMFDTLKEKGIDPERLYQEDKATNTTENFKYSLEIIKENGLNENIAIVTDSFHQLRARIICMQLGIKQNVGAVSADTSLKYLPVFAVREWFALPYQVLFR